MYKNMARTYWERWRWESQRRKELLLLQEHYHQQSLRPSTTDTMFPPQINTVMLTNLTDGFNNYIGQGRKFWNTVHGKILEG